MIKFYYCQQKSLPRTITLLQYQDWPSQSCPENPVDIIDLIEELECIQRKTGNNAIAVHCRYVNNTNCICESLRGLEYT